MNYNFDTFIDRSNTQSLKWLRHKGSDVIPMWLADMDFACPPEVVEAVKKRAVHPIYGYTEASDELKRIFIKRVYENSGWKIDPEWIIWLPGVVVGLNVACRTILRPGRMAAIPSPIYPPFIEAPHNMNQGYLITELENIEGRLSLDLDSIDTLIDDDVDLFYFCNPHNPGGSMASLDEINSIVEICNTKNVVICSDEIHSEIILDKSKKHIHLAQTSDIAARNSITFLAPSKSFNIAGLECASAIIPNKEIRDNFEASMKGIVPPVNIFAYEATMAAYKYGDKWLHELLQYLKKNRDILVENVNTMPGLSLYPPEATYLAWIDCSELNADSPAKFFIESGVGVADGSEFGDKNFIRINFACPESLLLKALDRMKEALG
tara:strand:+ start:1995 stop:3131 length:1137 start_codon:yes stop_codon:yes gene_type:complete